MSRSTYDEAMAAWAEDDMTLPVDSTTALRGAAAAEHGRAALARALGGRPSIDPTAAPGQHARVRQVRLPAELDQHLQQLAQQQDRTPSAVLRDAVKDYVQSHPVGRLRGTAAPRPPRRRRAMTATPATSGSASTSGPSGRDAAGAGSPADTSRTRVR